MNPLLTLIDAWISRRAVSREEARAATGDLTPIVVVTGGSEGIGLALARRFARAGHAIALVARREQPLAEAARIIGGEARTPVVTIALDITAPDAARLIVQQLAAEGFYLDVLVNNAGIGAAGAFAEQRAEEVLAVLDLNVGAASALMHAALPGMLARGRGGVLNVSSLGGYAPGPNQAVYYASKSYMLSLSEAVAEEVAGRGVRVAVLVPGPVSTAFHARMGAGSAFYRWLLPDLSPARVAWSGYWGFRLGRRVIVPGIFNLGMQFGLRIVPHRLMGPILAVLLAPRGKRADRSADNDANGS